MRPEDPLFDLKLMTRNNPFQGITMYAFRMNMVQKYPQLKSQKAWSKLMRYYVNTRKVEVFGEIKRIRPILTDFQKNTGKEVRITNDLVKDVVSEISPCTPTEAYKYFVQKYGWCNPESFTRLMRKLAQTGEINRDNKNNYSIGKVKIKPVFAYTKGLS